MQQIKQYISFLDSHRAKIASILAVVSSYVAAVSSSLNTNTKLGVIGAVVVTTYKFLDGNSKFEVSQQYNPPTK